MVAKIQLPADVLGLRCQPKTGHIWLALSDNTVRRVNPVSGSVTLVAGSGWRGGTDGQAEVASFYFRSLADFEFPSSSNDVLVADSGNDRIRRITEGSSVLTEYQNKAAFNSSFLLSPSGLCIMDDDLIVNGSYKIFKIGTNSEAKVILSDWSPFSVPPPCSVRRRSANSFFFLHPTNGACYHDLGSQQSRQIPLPSKTPCSGRGTIMGVPATSQQTDTPMSILFCHTNAPLLFQYSASDEWHSHPTLADILLADFDVVTNTLAYIQPSHPNSLFVAQQLFNPTLLTTHSGGSIDASLLFESNHLQMDASFTHLVSGDVIGLHSFILHSWNLPANIITEWARISLPSSSVRQMISLLYGSRKLFVDLCTAELDASFRASSDRNMELVELLLFAGQVLHLLHLSSCELLSVELGSQLSSCLRVMDVNDVVSLLILLWPSCYMDAKLVDLLIARLRSDPHCMERNAKQLEAVITGDSFASFLRVSMAIGNSAPLHTPTLLRGSPSLLNAIQSAGRTLRWIASTNSSLSTPPGDGCYSFRINDVPGHVLVKEWILYCSWKWFRRLVDAGLSEVQKRTVVLSSQMTPTLLLFLLNMFHYLPNFGLFRLSSEEHMSLMIHSEELEYDDSPLLLATLSTCRTKFSSMLRPNSCLQTLRHCWELQYRPLVDDLIAYVAQNWTKVAIQSQKDLALPQELLSLLFKAVAAAANPKK